MSERLRILLVEDNPGDADLIQELLPEDSFGAVEFVCAPRLSAALERLRADHFDLVLSDLDLPDSTGLDTIHALRQEIGGSTPIVVLTGNSDEQMGLAAIHAGAQDYAVKGQTSAALLSRILRYALERHRDAQRLREREEQLSRQYAILRGIIENADALIFSLDRAYCYTSFNRGHAAVMRAIYGVDIQIGGCLLDYMTVAADRDAAQTSLDRALRGEHFISESFSGDELLSRRFFEISHNPITDAPGQVIGMAVFSRDITERKRAEEALRESEERFRTLATSAPIGIYLTDAQGNCIYANKCWCDMGDLTPEEAYGQGWLNGLHPDDRATIGDKWYHSVASNGEWGFEYRFQNRHGKVTWVYGSAAPVYDHAGKLTGYVGTNMDITDRKQAEVRVKASEENFRNLAENALDGIVIGAADGRHLYGNQRAAEILGYSPAELLQTTQKDLADSAAYPMLKQRLQDRLAGRPLPSVYETLVRRKDGTAFPAEISGTRTMWQGQVCDLVFLRDITERKQAAEALRASEEQYRLIVETAQEGVWQIDADSRTTFVNRRMAEMLGYTVAEMAGAHLFDFMDEEGRQIAAANVERRRQGIAEQHDFKFRRKDGSDLWTLISTNHLLGDDGRYLGALAMVADISDRKQAEQALAQKTQELERSNRELEHFAYVASHDLQEPLRMVSGFMGLLAERYQGQLDADADEFIGFAIDGAKRMQRLIDGLLDYSRVGTRGQPFQSADATAALDDALWNLDLAIQDAGATVTHDPLPTVMADHDQLAQVFQNLIGNGIKFRGAEPPRVHISARQTFEVSETSKVSSKVWEFSVRDNGIGIAAGDIGRIFGIFQRLHSQAEYPGTGIGLATCKKIVERHGGRIWVELELGQGTTFYFTLPTET